MTERHRRARLIARSTLRMVARESINVNRTRILFLDVSRCRRHLVVGDISMIRLGASNE